MRRIIGFLAILLLAAISLGEARAQGSPFTNLRLEIAPGTVGPGTAVTAVFTITAGSASVEGLAFSTTLPASVTVAPLPLASTTCTSRGPAILSAEAGATSFSLGGGSLDAGDSCEVRVNLVSDTPGSHTVTSSALTWSTGLSGSAVDTLTVTPDRPGFFKSFTPASIAPGQTSRVMLTVDNSANASGLGSLSITDTLPSGMVLAAAPNATTDCGSSIVPTTITATPGSSSVSVFAYGFPPGSPSVPAGATCTVGFDVTIDSFGSYVNTASLSVNSVPAGTASAVLEATATPGTVQLVKRFTDDPVAAGSTGVLAFTLTNLNRDTATGISFTDDLDAMLSGVTRVATRSNSCAGSTVGGTSLVSFSGGSLGEGESCTVEIDYAVPAGAAAGEYTNTTSAVTAEIAGASNIGDPATDRLRVITDGGLPPAATLSAGGTTLVPGGVLELDFTITNPNSADPMSAIGLVLDYVNVLGPTTAVDVPFSPCGSGSSLGVNVSASFPIGRITLSNGSLAPGASCSFTVSLNIPSDLSAGNYTLQSDAVTGTVNAVALTGNRVSAGFTIGGNVDLSFTKAFDTSLAGAGESVDITFEIAAPAENAGDATAIAFSDDFAAMIGAGTRLAGATFSTVVENGCGGTVSGAGTGLLDYTGGILSPGQSCRITVSLAVPAAATSGTYVNTTSALSFTGNGVATNASPATDSLTVTGGGRFDYAKAFLDNPVAPGQSLVLRYTFDNTGNSGAATGIGFSDALGNVLPGTPDIVVDNVPATPCGGTGTVVGTSLVFSGMSVAAGGFCTIDVDITVPAGTADGDYQSATSTLTATLGGSAATLPAMVDTLAVETPLPTLSKAFEADTAIAGESTSFTLTIANATLATFTDLGFSDDLSVMGGDFRYTNITIPAGCPFSLAASTDTTASFTAASLAPGESCTITATLDVGGSTPGGTYTNTTSTLSALVGGASVTAPAASDAIRVLDTAPPAFAKTVSPGTVTPGGILSIDYTIDNSGTGSFAGLAFIDNLDAALSGLVATTLPTAPCGPGSSLTGTGVLTLTGASLGVGESCSFSVQAAVPATAATGTYTTTTSTLSDSGIDLGVAASDSFTIEPLPVFTMDFASNPVTQGEATTMTFRIDNSASGLAVDSGFFEVVLPAGLEIAPVPSASNTCGGTFDATAGGTSLSLADAIIPAGATCTASVRVSSEAVGTYLVTTSRLTTSRGTPRATVDPASASLTVDPAPVPRVELYATPATGIVGDTIRLDVLIRNDAHLAAEDFTLTFPSGFGVKAITDPSGAGVTITGGGGYSVTPSGDSVTFGPYDIAALTGAQFSVDIVPQDAVTSQATTGVATSSLGDSAAAVASLTVSYPPVPVVSKSFAPASIPQGGVSRMTITVDDSASPADLTYSLTDVLPAGMVLTDTATSTASLSCPAGAVADFTNGGDTVLLDAAVAGGGVCTIAVDVTAAAPGVLTNTTSDLSYGYRQSATLSAGGASAALTVTAAPVPGFTKAFAETSILPGATTTLTFTLDNSGALVDAADATFTDPLPAGLTIAAQANAISTCSGGTLSATTGGSDIALSGATIPAGAICTVAVDVTSSTVGTAENVTSELVTSLGRSAPATASLNVVPPDTVLFNKAFSVATATEGETVILTLTATNPNAFLEATAVTVDDVFPAGMVLASAPLADAGCGTPVLTGAAGDTALALSGGTVAPGGTCTVTADVTLDGTGTLVNTTSNQGSSLGASPAAQASITIAPADALVFGKSFSAATATEGETVILTLTATNPNAFLEATAVTVDDVFPAGMVLASAPLADAGCGTPVLTGAAGDTALALSGGTVAPGGTCTVTADVALTGSGQITNTTSNQGSSLGTSAAASASIDVTAATALTVTKAFSTAAATQGETVGLTLGLTNPNAFLEATGAGLEDIFPAGMELTGPPVADAGCGTPGLTGVAGDTALILSGATVAPGATCTVTATLRLTAAGRLTNTTSNQTSSLGAGAAAQATIAVAAAEPPSVALSFAPGTIEQAGTTRMTITLANASPADATGISVENSLPAGLAFAATPEVTTTCAGGLAGIAGDTLALSSARLLAGESCTVSASVTSDTVGVYVDTTERVTSSLGDSAAATGRLEVIRATTASVTLALETDTPGDYVFTSDAGPLNLTLTATGSATVSTAPLSVPTGRYSVRVAAPSGVGTARITCSDSDSRPRNRPGVLELDLAPLETVRCTFAMQGTRQQTVDTINRFLTRRADLILSSEPGSGRRFARLERGGGSRVLSFATGDLGAMLPFSFKASDSDFRFSTSLVQMQEARAHFGMAHDGVDASFRVDNHRFDIWFEGQVKRFDGGGSDGHFAIAYLGADWLANENVLIGAMLQVDDMDDGMDGAASTRGTGWMVGPYVTARIAPKLYFDGRIAMGRSSNEVSPFGTYTDTFDTTRWLAAAELTGEMQRGPWTIRPSASLSYWEETQEGYRDSLGVDIPSQTMKLGQIRLGPTFTGRFETTGGAVYSPSFGIDAIYNMGDTVGVSVTNDATPATEGWRGRITAGVDWTAKDGTSVSLSGTYDGLGRSDFNVWGLSFGIEIPLGGR